MTPLWLQIFAALLFFFGAFAIAVCCMDAFQRWTMRVHRRSLYRFEQLRKAPKGGTAA